MLQNGQRHNINQDMVLIQKVLSHDEIAFDQLFIKYRPIVNKIWGNYYLKEMDRDDWYQEARMVMLKIIQEYDFSRGVGFGCYYRRSLRNRFFDLIRRKNAQKRIPENFITSYNSNLDYLESVLIDANSYSPENTTLMNSALKKAFSEFSAFEQRILLKIMRGVSHSEIAIDEGCSVKKVTNAFDRCRKKFISQHY